MNTTVLEDVMTLINSNSKALNVPKAYIDFLGISRTDGALSIQSISSERIVKSYIDGSGEYQATFRLSLRKKAGTASSAVPLEILEALETLAALFSGMNDYSFPSGRIARRCAITAPSIIDRDDQGFITYGVSITLIYAEGV